MTNEKAHLSRVSVEALRSPWRNTTRNAHNMRTPARIVSNEISQVSTDDYFAAMLNRWSLYGRMRNVFR